MLGAEEARCLVGTRKQIGHARTPRVRNGAAVVDLAELEIKLELAFHP